MKVRFFILLCLCSTVSWSFAQKQIYAAPNLMEAISRHKTVAVLPFTVTISYKRMPKNFDAEGNKEDERKAGLNMQQGMMTYLLRKADTYSVGFQDVERTNALLRKAGIYDHLDEVLSDSICKVLGVDAVVKCTYSYEKTGSEGGAIATAMLFGYSHSTGSGSLTMQIHDGADGTLLWRFYKEMDEAAFSSGDALMERMMRKVARNFPYDKAYR